MIAPTLKKSVREHKFEFVLPDHTLEMYLVKWVQIENDTDGIIRHEVTVHHWEHEVTRWFKISDQPVILRKWLPTEKRSRKLLAYYL